ncbi:MAG: CBS domain-containing protein [bacterium]|nr:CBS domain-containing protein [bacterium]
MKIQQILADKGSDIWSIGPEATVFEALELLAEKKIGAVVVVEEGRLIGILSERDYARKVVLLGRGSRKTPVREIMSPDPCCVRPDQTIDDAMALMTAKRIRHLPVVEGAELLGIVTIGDVVKAKIADQEFVIQQLENYITS